MMQTHDSSKVCTQVFTDQHIHGIAGVDFATSPIEDIYAALELLHSRRTTQVTASLPTVAIGEIAPILDKLGPVMDAGLIAGVHLEGPFIAPSHAGAHPKDSCLAPASPQGRTFLQSVLEHHTRAPCLSMMTVAPELDGFETLVAQLVQHDITPALGHTAATYQQMQYGIDVVERLTNAPVVITHAYNAMRGFHHRDPGPILAILEAASADRVVVELIADGYHVDLALIRWWFAHYPQAIRLVSDASAATLIEGKSPVSATPPRLGRAQLRYRTDGSPGVADTNTLASGAKDLLAIHDVLVAAGLDHDLVCAAARA